MYLSYADALKGVVDPDAVEPLVGMIQQVKTWGDFQTKFLPASVVVNLIDEIKRLKEIEPAGSDE